MLGLRFVRKRREVRDVIPAGTLFRYTTEDGEPVDVLGITDLETGKQWIEEPEGSKIENVTWGTKDPQPKLSPPEDWIPRERERVQISS